MIPITITEKGELSVSPCTCGGSAISPESAAPEPATLDAACAAQPDHKAKGSYGQILKSSAMVGGSQVANIAIGIVRTKAMAVLLGPAGFGLFGLYTSVATLTQSIAGMGVNSSGVRQIAEAAGSGDQERIGMTAAVLRRTSILLGLLGALILVLFSRPISRLTFGAEDRAGAVALLSLVVLFTLVSGGQGALIQGMRRIADLAKMNVLGAFFGLCMSIPLVYFFREKGVVPSLISVAAVTVLTSWWYSRKVDVRIPRVTFPQFRGEALALLKLGSAFMASGLMVMGVGYFTRIMVLHNVGFEATGLYQSAWTLGGLYVGFILQAMGADFYPRLTASANDNPACNRLVNEQTLVGLLLAGPGVIATLTFAPLVLALLYSAKFAAAVEILRWITLGVTLQVITWPMGFIIVAKGRPAIFFYAEFAWTVVALALTWGCVKLWGANGAGIAFFGSYVFHLILIYPLVRWLSGFRWSSQNLRTGAIFLSLIALVFCSFFVVPTVIATVIGCLAILLSGVYAVRTLAKLTSIDRLPAPLRKLVLALGHVPAREA